MPAEPAEFDDVTVNMSVASSPLSPSVPAVRPMPVVGLNAEFDPRTKPMLEEAAPVVSDSNVM